MTREKDVLFLAPDESARDMIVACMREAIEKERREFWLDPEKHYKDHLTWSECMTPELIAEREANRAFVTDVRKGNEIAKKAGIVVIIGSMVAFVFGAVWYYIKAKLVD